MRGEDRLSLQANDNATILFQCLVRLVKVVNPSYLWVTLTSARRFIGTFATLTPSIASFLLLDLDFVDN